MGGAAQSQSTLQYHTSNASILQSGAITRTRDQATSRENTRFVRKSNIHNYSLILHAGMCVAKAIRCVNCYIYIYIYIYRFRKGKGQGHRPVCRNRNSIGTCMRTVSIQSRPRAKLFNALHSLFLLIFGARAVKCWTQLLCQITLKQTHQHYLF